MNSFIRKLQSQRVQQRHVDFGLPYTSNVVSKCVHLAGFADISENSSLVISNDPSFTNLALAEISPYGRIIPIDLSCDPYEFSINCCTFNSLSNLVAVSVGTDSVFIWDVQEHTDIQRISSPFSVRSLQHCLSSNSWMGYMNNSLVTVDANSNSYTNIPLSLPISAFRISPDGKTIAVCDVTNALSLYDIRNMEKPMLSLPCGSYDTASATAVVWNAEGDRLMANCGQYGVMCVNMKQLDCDDMIHCIDVTCNENYKRRNAFMDDVCLIGDDNGTVTCYLSSFEPSHSIQLSNSPVMSILPIPQYIVPFISSPYLVTTDTDCSLLSYATAPLPLTSQDQPATTAEEEEEADVVVVGRNTVDTEAEAWMLEGVQSDYGRCSFDQFGVCRQQVFICRTCRDQYDRLLAANHPLWSVNDIQSCYDVGALCEQCAIFCHSNKGHDVEAIGVKNGIACDCGNILFRRLDALQLLVESSGDAVGDLDDLPHMHDCVLCPQKALNSMNCSFNHNWRERWCYCNGEEELPMVMCVRCCDWFHCRCAEERYATSHDGRTIDLSDETIDFVCEQCEEVVSQCEEVVSQSQEVVSQSQEMVPQSQEMVPQSQEVVSQSQEVVPQQGTDIDSLVSLKAGVSQIADSREDPEKQLERRIRTKLLKNDRAGAFKIITKYMLKQSLNQSETSQRSIVTQTDVIGAMAIMERVIGKIRNNKI